MVKIPYRHQSVVSCPQLTAARICDVDDHPPAPRSRLELLGDLQRDVLERMARGRTNHEIAAELGLAPERVKDVVAGILGTLGVDSREAAIALHSHDLPLQGRPGATVETIHGNRVTAAALQAFGAVATVLFASVAVFALLRDDPTDHRPATADVLAAPTSTPSPTRDPAIPTRRPRVTPTIDIPGTIAARRPAPPVDQVGWPIIRCGDGTAVQKLTNRRITLCLPEGWTFTEVASTDATQGVFSETVRLGLPASRTAGAEILFITRRSALNTKVLEPSCNERTAGSVFLGLQALRCDATWDVANGMPIHPNIGWTTTLFVESPGDWVLVELIGQERDPAAIEAARANLVALLGRAVENGCQSPTPSMC